MKKQIGWVPFVSGESKSLNGLWVAYFKSSKQAVRHCMAGQGFKYKLVPVFAEMKTKEDR